MHHSRGEPGRRRLWVRPGIGTVISDARSRPDTDPRVRWGTRNPRPGLADDNAALALLQDLFEGLTTEAADGSLIPGAAESWSDQPGFPALDLHAATGPALVER